MALCPQVLGPKLWWVQPRYSLPSYQAGTRVSSRDNYKAQELRNHPNKAWIAWLLSGIDNGVSTGYNRPRFPPHTARNLASELKHPDIIDAELSKEIAAGRILGPFSEHLLTNLRTSGLGAVQMKNGSSCIWHQ